MNQFSLHGNWKKTLSFKNFRLLSIELTKQVLSCNDFPIKRMTQEISFLEAFSTASFLIKTLSKFFFKQKSTKF